MAYLSSPKKKSVSLHLVEGSDDSNFGPYAPTKESHGKSLEYNDMYSFLQMSPELMGITQAVCDDILGGGPIEWNGSNSAVKDASEWAKRNHFKKKLYSALQDYVLTGDGYLGVSVLTRKVFFEMYSNLRKHFPISSPEEFFEKIRSKSPYITYPRELFVLKTTTISISYDKHGRIKYYVQKVDGISQPIKFSPDEVIHLSLNNLGHDVYGYSPNWSSLNELAAIWYAKDYAGTFFQNDGTPDWMYILADEAPNSPNVEKFKRTLKEYKKSKNKHKSMVITGNVEVRKLNDFNKDLEFRSLIDVFTERLLMAWNMPPTRVSGLKGNYRSTIESTEGYYKKINRLQAEIEETLNNELWWRFGDVEMRFPRSYKRDESREADIVSRLVGRPVWTPNEGRRYLGNKPIDDDESMNIVLNKPMRPLGRTQDIKLPEETGNQYISSSEKMFKGKSILDIKSFDQFVMIVEQTGLPFNQAKVFVREDDNKYVFFFSDSLWSYECSLLKKDIFLFANDYDEFYQKYLSGAIKVKSD